MLFPVIEMALSDLEKKFNLETLMLKVDKYSISGEKLEQIELPESLFAARSKNNKAVLYEVINLFLANQRQGTSSTQTRAEAHGSKRKLYRQKGTGNARAGNLRTPIRVGGGRAFGPKPKKWHKKIPLKKKRLALKLALTQRADNQEIIILEDLKFDEPNTKKALEIIKKISPEKGRKLLLIDSNDHNIIRSFNNIPKVAMGKADSIFAYQILKTKNLIITESALKKMKEVFAK